MSKEYYGPYIFRTVKNLSHQYYPGENILNPNQILDYQKTHTCDARWLYADQVEFVFDPPRYEEFFGKNTLMGGLYTVLTNLPGDKPIESKIVRSLLLAFFGNAAKKKLATLETPDQIFAWIRNNIDEVNSFMGIAPFPTQATSPEKKTSSKAPIEGTAYATSWSTNINVNTLPITPQMLEDMHRRIQINHLTTGNEPIITTN